MASTITADNGVVSGSAGIKSSADSSGVLALASGTGTTAVTIDTSQNVGIGTSSPAYKLDLSGAIKIGTGTDGGSGNLFLDNGSTFAQYGYRLGWFTGANSARTERMRLDENGNVGIGTSSPASKLHVAGSFRQTGATVPFEWTVNPGAADYYKLNGVGYADNLIVASSNGNVGIGTASPGAKLQVSGSSVGTIDTAVTNTQSSTSATIAATSTTYSFAGIGPNTAWFLGSGTVALGNYSANPIQFVNNGAERARIDSSGHFVQAAGCRIYSIGTYNLTTAAAANLNVDGNGTFFRSTSALKYKKDIRDLESIDVNLFRAVRYKSKSESDDQTKDHFGIVADEVHAAGITELVNYGVDGEVEGFQYERLTVVLLKHCQEQQALINNLTERLAALEAK